MNILYTAFNGKNNSSKILLDNIDSNNKLYLKNSFKTSVEQLKSKIKSNEYDLIISFGQAPLNKNVIKIETTGKNNDFYKTNYDYINLKNKLDVKYNVIISNDAGNYLCNNIYYNGLKYIKENELKSKMIFIHIPKINNIENVSLLSSIFNNMQNEIFDLNY